MPLPIRFFSFLFFLLIFKINAIGYSYSDVFLTSFSDSSFVENSSYRRLSINEILPIPNSNQAEFVELVNNYSRSVNLENWRLADKTRGVILPKFNLKPQEVIVLAREKDSLRFSKIENILFLASIPTLNNSGDQLKLFDNQGILVDSMAYSSSQVSVSNSLEQINPDFFSYKKENWVSHSKEHSAGFRNENFDLNFEIDLDLNPPKLLNLLVQNEKQITLFFDEKVKETESLSLSISGILENQFRTEILDSVLQITFSETLENQKDYSLRLDGVRDFSKNESETIETVFRIKNILDSIKILDKSILRFYLKEGLVRGDVKISNFSFSPKLKVDTFRLGQKGFFLDLILGDKLRTNTFYTFLSTNIGLAIEDKAQLLSSNFILDTKKPKVVRHEIIDSNHVTVFFDEQIVVPKRTCSSQEILYSLKNPSSLNLFFSEGIPNQKQVKIQLCGIQDLYENQMKDFDLELYYDTMDVRVSRLSVLSKDSIFVNFSRSLFMTDSSEFVILDKKKETYSSHFTSLFSKESNAFLLKLEKDIPDSDSLVLRIKNLGIDFSNREDRLAFFFDSQALTVSSFYVVDSKQIFIAFNKSIDSIFMLRPENYDFQNDNKVLSVEFRNSNEIILNLENDLRKGEINDLNIIEIRGKHGHFSENESLDFIYEDGIEDIRYTSHAYVEVMYKQDFVYSFKNSHFRIGKQTATFHQLENNKLILAFDEKVKPLDTLFLPFIDLGFQNKISASRHVLRFDFEKPFLERIKQRGSRNIELVFNEKVNFSLENIEIEDYAIEEVSKLGNREFLVSLANKKERETELNVCLNSIKDENGNEFSDSCFTFFYKPVEEVSPRDIRFSEFRVHLSSDLDLVNAQYVELHNRTDYVIDLTGFMFSDGAKSVKIPPYILKSKQYLVLCDAKNKTKFSSSDSVIGIESLPQLNQDSDYLNLKDDQGNLIDDLFYDKLWFRNSELGKSLEIIDLDFDCSESKNWEVSRAEIGGTPNKRNSINASITDNIAPKVEKSFVLEDSLFLFFDENIARIPSFSDIEIKSDLEIESIEYYGSSKNKLVLKLKQASLDSLPYEMKIKGLVDCSGNLSNAEIKVKPVFRTKEGDLSFNEVLFNDNSLKLEFIELYNSSYYSLDLKDLAILKNLSDTLKAKTVTREHFIFPSNAFISICYNERKLKENYPKHGDLFLENESVFPLANQRGRLFLFDLKSKNILDSMYYDESMHHASLSDISKVSLEKIERKESSYISENWTSASDDYHHASPSLQNSQAMLFENGNKDIKLSSTSISPNNDGFQDFIKINFNLEGNNNTLNIRIYNKEGLLIRYLAKNLRLGNSGSVLWDGRGDGQDLVLKGNYPLLIEIIDAEGRQYIERKYVSVTR